MAHDLWYYLFYNGHAKDSILNWSLLAYIMVISIVINIVRKDRRIAAVELFIYFISWMVQIVVWQFDSITIHTFGISLVWNAFLGIYIVAIYLFIKKDREMHRAVFALSMAGYHPCVALDIYYAVIPLRKQQHHFTVIVHACAVVMGICLWVVPVLCCEYKSEKQNELALAENTAISDEEVDL